MSSSPDLPHKIPARMIRKSEQESDDEVLDDSHEKSNLFGVHFVMWFEVGIEGKDPMDREEEDWGGTIQFGFKDKKFSQEMEDYFLPFEDRCSQSHTCAGISQVRDKLLKPPDYEPGDIVALVEKYGDAHISDSGWRAVDPEEWYSDR